MAVDNTLRYRGFNSYNLEAGETLYSSLSDCEYLGFVTTQWVALKAGGTIAGGEVRITWIDDTGGQFGSAELYEFTPTRLWERHTWTVAVPPEAVKLRIQFGGGTQGYHFACPMTEPGEIASSFDPNIASAVAYMTSEGAYVGFLNAEQITAGLLRAVNGGAWFDLDKPEIVMEGKQADLSITPENPLKLTDKSGKFVGGLGVIEGLLGLVAGVLTDDVEGGARATIGTGTDGHKGIDFTDGENRYQLTTSDGDGVALYVNGDKRQVWRYEEVSSLLGEHVLFYFNDAARSNMSGSDSSYFFAGQNRLAYKSGPKTSTGNGPLSITGLVNQAGMSSLGVYAGNETGFTATDSQSMRWVQAGLMNGYRFQAHDGLAELRNGSGDHALGIDSGGPYRIKNGTKTYF